MSEHASEILETEQLLEKATFAGTKALLQSHLEKLRRLETASTSLKEPVKQTEATPEASNLTASQSTKRAVVSSSGTFIAIENFAWDQGAYGTPSVSIFVDLDDVGTVKDNVNVEFTKSSFDLTVRDLNGKNYRLLKDNLEKDIIPDQSTFVVKKNKVVIKLQKVKGEYSYDHWTTLTNKKKKSDVEATKKDPTAGIMDMMKNMYDEGDENMKKIIGEAMMKSRSGEKPSMPSMNDMGDDGF